MGHGAILPRILFLGIQLLWALGLAPGLPAQERPSAPLTIQLAPASGGAVLVLGDLWASSQLRGAVESGLPVRIRVVTELFRDRFLGGQEGRAEWRATVVKDPLEGHFVIQRGDVEGSEQKVASLQEVRAALAAPLPLVLRPGAPGRYFYQASLEVETLSLTDLEELQRWLRGELGPAVTGGREMESAVNRGLRRMFIRLLGLPVQRYQTRSASFNYPS